LVDPGMGKQNMIQCLADAKPEGVVGIPLAQVARWIYRKKLGACKLNFVVGSRWWPGCVATQSFEALNANEFDPLSHSRETDAAIIFTTGSTGPPKGVLYRHRNFLEQAEQIRDYFDIRPGSVDVSGFPLFALFNCAMGTTTVFPKMDATRPADVDPLDISDAINRFQATQSFGSPALWNTVAGYASQNDIRFPSVKMVLSAGAPVPPHVLQKIEQVIGDDGRAYTPYGATEALPVACNCSSEVLGETAEQTNLGMGTCVGKRFPKMDWKVIEITDDPISKIDNVIELPREEIGELIVRGPVVTDQYVTRTEANADHKIKDSKSQSTSYWHRMGDVGYIDSQDRFWFCGRKSHRVITSDGTVFTVVVEAIVNTHPRIYRSGLVGIGQYGFQLPVVVAEPWPEFWTDDPIEQQSIKDEILQICQQNTKSKMIQQVLLKKALPVDIRHNSKIFREQLVDWARERC
ncbi:MAG: fatty acid CoA ligase family protein, partial [Planctomycetota bacterium]